MQNFQFLFLQKVSEKMSGKISKSVKNVTKNVTKKVEKTTTKETPEYMCYDYTKHPEYAKILEIKDKKIQERVLNIHKKNCEKGFDLRKYIQKFQSGQSYVIKSLKRGTTKTGAEWIKLTDEVGYQYFANQKTIKYINEKEIPDEIPESAIFTITGLDENYFINEEGKYIIYTPLSLNYICEESEKSEESEEAPEPEDF